MVRLGAAKRPVENAELRPHDAKEHALYCEAISELAKCLKGQENSGASSG